VLLLLVNGSNTLPPEVETSGEEEKGSNTGAWPGAVVACPLVGMVLGESRDRRSIPNVLDAGGGFATGGATAAGDFIDKDPRPIELLPTGG
jgi:hypothetical protein